MNRVFFTAGPSQYYPTVPDHLRKAIDEQIISISHRGPQFAQIYQDAVDGVKQVMEAPEDFTVYFFSSATEIWDRLVENGIQTKGCFLVNGMFGEKFYWSAERLGKEATKIEVPHRTAFDLNAVDISSDTELVGITHNESSTGSCTDMETIHKLRDKAPHALIAVDMVSSAPYPKVDYSAVDAVYFSVQKGFGLPAGLGVALLSPRFIAKSQHMEQKGAMVGSYHSFGNLASYAIKHQTPETPNVLNLYLLSKVTQDLLKVGLNQIRRDTRTKAAMLYSFFDSCWVNTPMVPADQGRSETLITIDSGGNASRIINEMLDYGYELGYGYGKWKQEHIRIANFPSHSIEDVQQMLHHLKPHVQ